NSFTQQQLMLSENQDQLIEFIGLPFSKEAFLKQIQIKSENYNQANRILIHKVLKSKYDALGNKAKSLENIEKLLNINCYTVVTGHQLCLLTGPIYFIYKILHVIKQCEELNKLYPQNKFVPIYWMASEDHDFDEIKSISIFGKTLNWESNQSGAIGRMNLSGIPEVLDEFKQFFSNNKGEIDNLIQEFNGTTYGEAFFRFIHSMFAEYGLVIIDGDEREFKQAFAPLMKNEIQTSYSFKAVNLVNQRLEKRKFKIQVNPREVNLFYLKNSERERIFRNSKNFIVGEKELSEKEVLDLIDSEPESFSPNVILRPLYQEFLLPNLCYVGGVGELNYWLQLKGIFESSEIPYPLIQPRTSALWIDSSAKQKIDRLNLSIIDLFKSLNELKKQILILNESENLNFELNDIQFNQFKTDFAEKAFRIDASFKSRVGAEFTKIEKQIENLKDQLEKSVKSKHEKSLSGVEQIKHKLFPYNSLQERSVNFFQFCSGGNFSEKLREISNKMEVFNSDILILEDE
ncbi:MAG: bacillithiol biosynthesis cysteine-adding enzyme BshC, partial [Bacteroidota bacterium]